LNNQARVAFVTHQGLAGLNADDRLAADALIGLGTPTAAVCWDDPAVDWLDYRAVVLRSTWDYQDRVAEFRGWIDRMETIGARLWNPPHVLRWNIDKRYLARLADFPPLSPPPTEILDRGSAVDLAVLLDAHGWEEAVLKPTISADGRATERTSRAAAASDQPALDRLLAEHDVIVQQLVPEIQTGGEISMMFFGAAYSHAVSKRPQHGEFRVQERLGGRIVRTEPPPLLIEAAQAVVNQHAPDCLYARVDAVITEPRFVLMEVELVEPSLYLGYEPLAAQTFAHAVRRIA
jgi:glutathione synthase/RimK-type ligase-like ATP-grasp enzyme